MTVAPIADFSWARPPVKAYGYSGVARYLSPDPTKNLTVAERDQYRSQQLDILLVWESGNQRAALSGAAGGIADANSARAQAAVLGYPAVVYFVLEDPTRLPPSAWPAIEAYARAARSVLGRIGGYGSQALIEHLLAVGAIDFGWQVGGWSDNTSGMCHLYQRGRPTLSPVNGQLDEDAVLKDEYGQWHGHLVRPLATIFVTHSGQELATMALITAPDGVRQDIVSINPDGSVQHTWAPDGNLTKAAGTENIGGVATAVAASWDKNNTFRVLAHGSDDQLYVKVSDGTKWVQDWTGLGITVAPPHVGPRGEAGPAGPQGPQGPAGGSETSAGVDWSPLKSAVNQLP